MFFLWQRNQCNFFHQIQHLKFKLQTREWRETQSRDVASRWRSAMLQWRKSNIKRSSSLWHNSKFQQYWGQISRDISVKRCWQSGFNKHGKQNTECEEVMGVTTSTEWHGSKQAKRCVSFSIYNTKNTAGVHQDVWSVALDIQKDLVWVDKLEIFDDVANFPPS